ncbi:MAG: cytochrome c3 family protein [Gammaproteobacteria bacterium]|nr:cytochrome c3 family protein [Gammaproteobacteria bacterium]
MRSDQWAEVKFEFKKLALKNADDFKALRDLQYQVAKKIAERCTGSCGKPINYQMHPVRNQDCTLCHDKFLKDHESGEMIINEYNPDASCGACHDDELYKKILGEKIPYWTMSFAEMSEDGAQPKISALFARSQSAAEMLFPNAPLDLFAKAEGKFKQEFKSRLGAIESDQLEELAILLGSSLELAVSVWPVTDGALVGKVEAKSDEKSDDMKEYISDFEKKLKPLKDLVKETKLESKYKPPMPPVEAMDFIVREVTKRFKNAELKEQKDDKVVWMVDEAEIKVEFKKDETKFKFTNFPVNPKHGFKDALEVLKKSEKAFRDATLHEIKFAHAYSGMEDDQQLIADVINGYKVKKLPSKDLKYELAGDKDTGSVGLVTTLLPMKVGQYDKESILKLKTEVKVKYDKPLEPEVKSEVAMTKAAPAVKAPPKPKR